MTDWKEICRRFALETKSLSLEEKALSFLEGLPADRPVLLACSGGADSVCMVLSLVSRLGNPGRFHILHFNHGLRGVASDCDAAFVEDLAGQLGSRVSIGKPPTLLDPGESSLRSARYAWMDRMYAQTGAGALCLGHHADDLLETQLMALLTGSGPSGLASPMPVRRFASGHYRVRPLLSMKRPQIESVLQAVGSPWREDASNLDSAYTRNRIREQFLPLLQDLLPQDVFAGSGLTRKLMEEALEVVDRAVEERGLDCSDPEELRVSALQEQPPGLVRRAIQAWWMRHRPDWIFPNAALETLIAAVSAGRRVYPVSVGRGKLLALENGELTLLDEHPAEPCRWPSAFLWHWSSGPLFLPDGNRLCGEQVAFKEANPPPYRCADPALEAWMAIEDATLEVRQWQPGDRYRPLGAPGTRKLQDLFTDSKMDGEQKRLLPVILSASGNILWVPGFPPADSVRITPGCKSALKLTYKPHSSGLPPDYGRQTKPSA